MRFSPSQFKFSGLIRTTFSSVVRHRNYRLFFFGQTISLIGTWLQTTALAWLVYTITKDSRALGIMGFLSMVPVLFLGVYSGTVADEYPKRKILIITQSLLALFAFLLAFFVWQNWAALWLLGLVNLLAGATVAFDLPTRQAFVVEMVGKEDVANAVALNSSIFNAARLVGPALGALIIATISISMCFFLNGVSFIAVIIGLFMMRLPKESRLKRENGVSRMQSMKEGIHYLYHIPNFRALMLLVMAMTLFAWGYTVNLPVIAAESLKGDSATYGALLSANGLGALIAALTQAAFSHKMRARFMTYLSIATFIISINLIPFFSTTLPVLFCLGVTGWSVITFFITANSTFQRFVPDELRGRVMGIYALASGGLTPFSSLLAGYLAHEYGINAAFWTDSAILLIVASLTYNFVRKLPSLSVVAEKTGSKAIRVEQYKEIVAA